MLASLADMRAALTDQQPGDRHAAGQARQPFPPIDLKVVLEVAAMVNPDKTCAIPVDIFHQRRKNDGNYILDANLMIMGSN